MEASRSLERQLNGELKALEWRMRNMAMLEADKVRRFYAQAADYEANITRVVEDNLKQVEQAYGQGRISMTELFRAQEHGLQIKSAQLEILRDYELALIEWSAVTGLQATN